MVRPMVRSDREAVMNILRQTAMFTPEEIGVAAEVMDAALDRPEQKDYFLVVWEEDGRVAGYAAYGPTPLTQGTYDLYWIAVSPDRQGSGLGRHLMDWVESRLQESGGRLLLIETSSQTRYDPTRRFYLRLGYREAARIADFYRPGDDRVTYAKYLG
jgi:ribosomal protein S18 acetylase RimI-like enzyme